MFHVPAGAEQPFKNVARAGFDAQGLALWALVCDPGHKWCSTGPAHMKAIENTYIKTDQILDAKKPCDAGIIIQP